jgi:hypothetical protein
MLMACFCAVWTFASADPLTDQPSSSDHNVEVSAAML